MRGTLGHLAGTASGRWTRPDRSTPGIGEPATTPDSSSIDTASASAVSQAPGLMANG